MKLEDLAKKARNAATDLATSSEELRNHALEELAAELKTQAKTIFEANAADLEAAHSEGLAKPLLKRLALDEAKLEGLVEGILALIKLPDPIGKTSLHTELAPGLELRRVACPIGVIGVIFESRPDAFIQIATLCLKSGNACLLKGGREALRTNRALRDALLTATDRVGLPHGWAELLETRQDVADMLSLDRYIDLLIPRGSNEFVRHIQDNTRIPVMGHSSGICHLYVDKEAELEMAVKVAVDAKTQAPATCNSIETLLVHEGVAHDFLPMLKRAMDLKGVKLIGDKKVAGSIPCENAKKSTWDTEYLDLALNVKVVETMQEAITHINEHGSHHTDAIITGNRTAADAFMAGVDSADVFWNCSTRFADGFRFGLGAEVGIATGKLHARGPVGLEGLMSYKWLLQGRGQIVAPFASGEQAFTHKELPF